jgi:hypothetical protein
MPRWIPETVQRVFFRLIDPLSNRDIYLHPHFPSTTNFLRGAPRTILQVAHTPSVRYVLAPKAHVVFRKVPS